MRKRSLLCLSLFLSSLIFAQQPKDHRSLAEDTLSSRDGWALQSSCKVEQKGDAVSTPKFRPQGWYAVSVPTTVFAALVKHKVYADPDFSMNLRSAPGVTYPIGANSSNIPMQPDSPYIVPWWYRKEFLIPASYKGKALWLNFHGINYKANIWLNGKQIANSDDVAGAWRTYEFNITGAAKPGATNVLAVQVFSPTDTDLAITFVDWNPAPPDKNMGLWRAVDITTSGPVALRYPTVVSKVDSPQNTSAHLTVTALLKNGTNGPVKGTLKGRIEHIEFSQDVEVAAGESKDVTFAPEQFSQLNISSPRLWWPAQMGKPELYKLDMEFVVAGKISDKSEANFGIREVTSQVLAANRRLFSINGKNILIRGGGWSPDMMLRENSQRLEDEFRYVQDMGLNTIRLEGKLETKEFFDLADRKGVLIMAGWCCCDHWEHWAKWKPEDFKIAEQSLRDQMYGMRTHPSLVMWLNGSDNPPPPDVEQTYLRVEKEHLWPIDDFWNYHAGGGSFKDIHVFADALNARYGKADNAEDFTFKSQLQTYEGVRAMYEAYSRNKYQSTGVIQWMLNNAWPSIIWHLYDFYLRPGGGYFGAKRAMEQLHPLYGYDDRSVWVVSSQYQNAKGLKLTTKVLNLDMTEKYSHQDAVDATADSTTKILTLPDIGGLGPTYFLVLRLEDQNGKLVGSNFYWLSTSPEKIDWEKSNWYTTPTASYADFTALSQLPKVKLKVADRTERKGADAITHVMVENPSKSLAFFVRLKVNKAGQEILPVVWQDNYISLLPGGKREISATYRASELGAARPVVEISGWDRDWGLPLHAPR